MANKPQGPRQPLSQRRPKVAASRTSPTKSSARPKSLLPRGKSSDARAAVRGPQRREIGKGPTTPRLAGRKQTATAKRTRSRPSPATIYDRLTALYPDAHCELDFGTPFQLLVATILSAQCTDKRVNMVTPLLFTRYPTVASLAAARQEDVEEIIKSTGFFRNKAKSIIGMANALVDRHGGDVPSSMDALVTLPGVGRKTANVILGNAFGRNDGVVVDTHVGRLALRLGLTTETDPIKVELELMRLFDQPRWTMLSHLLIWHGRRVCEAKRPRCGECTLSTLCPSSLV